MDGNASSRTAVVAGAKRSSAFKLPTNKYGCGERLTTRHNQRIDGRGATGGQITREHGRDDAARTQTRTLTDRWG
jgi:hypothetical protein